MSDRDRWERLQADLQAAGIDVQIDATAYPGGIRRSISVRAANGNFIEVNDGWWRKNDNVWIGYGVYVSDRDDIVIGQRQGLKKRSLVVAAVAAAMRGERL